MTQIYQHMVLCHLGNVLGVSSGLVDDDLLVSVVVIMIMEMEVKVILIGLCDSGSDSDSGNNSDMLM
jgi:hypothetical protein